MANEPILPVCFADYCFEADVCHECENHLKFACLLGTIQSLWREEEYWADRWYECAMKLEAINDVGKDIRYLRGRDKVYLIKQYKDRALVEAVDMVFLRYGNVFTAKMKGERFTTLVRFCWRKRRP